MNLKAQLPRLPRARTAKHCSLSRDCTHPNGSHIFSSFFGEKKNIYTRGKKGGCLCRAVIIVGVQGRSCLGCTHSPRAGQGGLHSPLCGDTKARPKIGFTSVLSPSGRSWAGRAVPRTVSNPRLRRAVCRSLSGRGGRLDRRSQRGAATSGTSLVAGGGCLPCPQTVLNPLGDVNRVFVCHSAFFYTSA